jgi:hypothetical protein
LLTVVRSALTAAAFSEAERIVFAAEGLFLAHDFSFYCRIRVEAIQMQQFQRPGCRLEFILSIAAGPAWRKERV